MGRRRGGGGGHIFPTGLTDPVFPLKKAAPSSFVQMCCIPSSGRRVVDMSGKERRCEYAYMGWTTCFPENIDIVALGSRPCMICRWMRCKRWNLGQKKSATKGFLPPKGRSRMRRRRRGRRRRKKKDKKHLLFPNRKGKQQQVAPFNPRMNRERGTGKRNKSQFPFSSDSNGRLSVATQK